LRAAVAIDGPAGAGKSTVGRALARRLGWLYVDTGAMYRAATLKALRMGAEFADAAALAKIAADARIEFVDEPAPGDESPVRVLLDGEDVTEAIRRPELTRHVKHVASCAAARREMVRRQRELAESRPVVMEGRDIGTVVLPDAVAKFYLDASLEERARRRAIDIERQGGGPADLATVMRELELRDRSDRERDAGPLARAEDAEVVDTTGMTVAEVVEALESRTRSRLAAAARSARAGDGASDVDHGVRGTAVRP